MQDKIDPWNEVSTDGTTQQITHKKKLIFTQHPFGRDGSYLVVETKKDEKKDRFLYSNDSVSQRAFTNVSRKTEP